MNYQDVILDIWNKLGRIEQKLDATLNLFKLALVNVEIKAEEVKNRE